jgi:NodT family efflux transporter outer membrane factor (OMF) lipoprotein
MTRSFPKPASAVLALALSACAVGPDFAPPPAPDVQGYTLTEMTKALTAGGDEAQQTLTLGQTVSSEWWALFHADPLNDVVKQALAHNPNLAAAQATLAGAQAAVRQAESGLYPQLDANAGFQRGKSSSYPITNLYAVGATASYTLDVFGETRRTIERQEALAENQFYQLGAAYLTLTGNVVTQSLNVAALRAQLTATKEIVADDEKNLHLVQEELAAGKAAQTDVLTAQTQLANDRTQIPPLRQQISAAKHALAILAGQFPGAWKPPKFDLAQFTLPTDLPVSLPSALAHQRPDILAAEAQLHADSAAIGIATAQMYPSITLSSAASFQAIATNQLFSESNLFWSLASGLTAPLFHGGALEAQKEQAVDAFKTSAALYRQTVLAAFGQVADTLRALKNDADLLAAQKQALETAQASLDLQRISYAMGKSDVLLLLNAERGYQQACLGYVHAQGQRLQDTAQLFLALGGGWWDVKDQIAETTQEP